MSDIKAIRQKVSAAIKSRREAGETLEQIAASLGVHWVTVWKWEQQQQIRPSVAALITLITTSDDQVAA